MLQLRARLGGVGVHVDVLGPAGDGGQLDVAVAGFGDAGQRLLGGVGVVRVGVCRRGRSSARNLRARPQDRRPEHVRRRLQHRQPRVGHVEHPVGASAAPAAAAAGPRAPSASARRSPPSTTASRSRRCSSSTRAATSGRRLERDARLALAAAREPLLARAARAVAAVDLPAPDLRGHEPAAGEHAGGVSAEPDQQHADHAVARRVVEQRRRVEPSRTPVTCGSGGNGGSQSTRAARADERDAPGAELGPLHRPVARPPSGRASGRAARAGPRSARSPAKLRG